MKKKLLIFAVITVTALSTLFAACGNKDMFDTVYTYNYAIIRLQDGTIVEGRVQKWTDYEDGDQLQVTIGGVTYLEHSSNVDLMTKKK